MRVLEGLAVAMDEVSPSILFRPFRALAERLRLGDSALGCCLLRLVLVIWIKGSSERATAFAGCFRRCRVAADGFTCFGTVVEHHLDI